MSAFGAVNKWTWRYFYSEFRYWRRYASWQTPGLSGPQKLWVAANYAYWTTHLGDK